MAASFVGPLGIDVQPPAAAVSAASVSEAGAASHDVVITYTDDTGIDTSTIDAGDLAVTGPGGAALAVTGVSFTPAGSSTLVAATYAVAAPGGAWDFADNGAYAAALKAGGVLDLAGNPVPDAAATFAVAAPPANVNVSRLAGHQSEGSVAIDPTDSSRLFAASNMNATSLFGAVSSDGGATWTGRAFADGADGLPQACCDPSAAFDAFGNLFFTYIHKDTRKTELLLSTDGGLSFTHLIEFPERSDQPTVVTGPGSVWVGYLVRNPDADTGGAPGRRPAAVARGAVVSGKGVVGKFKRKGQPVAQIFEGATEQNVGDLAVGPAGQVLVAYQRPTPAREGRTTIFVRRDPDGVRGKKFGPAVGVAETNVGDADFIPAQSRRSIDAAVGLAYDHSAGPFAGRVYLVYSDENPDESNDTDVMLRYSDDDGTSWSAPARVNDDATANSQFLPRLAVDRATGGVALVWHDSRNDAGVPGSGSTDNVPNNDAEFWGVTGVPGPAGVTFGPNVRLGAGVSNGRATNQPIEYGDYVGLDFARGVAQAVWADNSNSTGDNPDGALSGMDIYTARFAGPLPAPPPAVPLAGLSAKPIVKRGKSFSFNVAYTDRSGTGAATGITGVDGNDVRVTGPNGFSQLASLSRLRTKGNTVTATYRVGGPGGAWDPADRGAYVISLLENQVSDAAGQFAAARDFFGTFRVP